MEKIVLNAKNYRKFLKKFSNKVTTPETNQEKLTAREAEACLPSEYERKRRKSTQQDGPKRRIWKL